MANLDEILRLRDRDALFVLKHSSGKDSQCMTIKVLELVPREQILIVHADLGEVEWAGNKAHIEATTDGLPLIIAEPVRGLLKMVASRGMGPSPQIRQCTSDLKRGPSTARSAGPSRIIPSSGGSW